MRRTRGDQADGLRRLRAGDAVRIVTVIGGESGAGTTSAVVNLAQALARAGKHVLVLDENPCHDNVVAQLGLSARYDLLHVINRDKPLEEVLVPGPDNILVLPAMRGMRRLARLERNEQQFLIECFHMLPRPVDVILVDAASGSAAHGLPVCLASQQILVVMSPSARSITGAYALIKEMSREYARRRFLILVNKAASDEAARVVFDNISSAARRHLSVSLEFVGGVRRDEKLRRSAALCRPVVEAFPDAVSAAGFRGVTENLLRCPHAGEYGNRVENFVQRLLRSSRLECAATGIH